MKQFCYLCCILFTLVVQLWYYDMGKPVLLTWICHCIVYVFFQWSLLGTCRKRNMLLLCQALWGQYCYVPWLVTSYLVSIVTIAHYYVFSFGNKTAHSMPAPKAIADSLSRNSMRSNLNVNLWHWRTWCFQSKAQISQCGWTSLKLRRKHHPLRTDTRFLDQSWWGLWFKWPVATRHSP